MNEAIEKIHELVKDFIIEVRTLEKWVVITVENEYGGLVDGHGGTIQDAIEALNHNVDLWIAEQGIP